MQSKRHPVVRIDPDVAFALDIDPLRASWSGQTTNATPTEIFVNGVTDNRLSVPESACVTFDILVAVRDIDNDTGFSLHARFGVKRDDSNNTSVVGFAPLTFDLGNEITGASVQIQIDDTNDSVNIIATGHATHTVNWAAKVVGYVQV